MTQDSALALAAECVAEVMQVSAASISAQTRLGQDLGMDSIAFVQLADALEARLAARGSAAVITDDTLLGFETLGDVAHHLVAIA